MVNQFLGKPEHDAGRKLLGKRSREEAPDYVERVAELRAEGRSESEIEIIFNNEENEERDQHEAKKQFRASFNHLKKTCPGEDIAGLAIDSEVEQRLEAIQKQKEIEEWEPCPKSMRVSLPQQVLGTS